MSTIRSADRQRPRVPLALAVTLAATLLFVAIAAPVLGAALRRALGSGERLDDTLLIALILNVALILIGWRRQRDVAAGDAARAEALGRDDAVTGLLGRRGFAEAAGAALARARGSVIAVLLLDLDNFRMVNDLHGHAAGDTLLGEVATVLAACLPPDTPAARLGGDEFACAIVFDPAHPTRVEEIADGIAQRLATGLDASGQRRHVSASIGIARSDRDGGSVDALLRSAEIAMYAAKQAGRGGSAWFAVAMEHDLRARGELEMGLRTAIPRGEIVPWFEQQVDLATGALSGFEVLARWQHPTRGLIAPDRFIGLAEEHGLIGDLSLSIMQQAFSAARDWDPSLTLSVNISPAQLLDPWLPQKIIKVLTETGFPARRLEVEITESALLDNLELARTIVSSLKNQGVRLALDDFGTGYSSLAHLRALPFDRIKVDRSFVAALPTSADSAAIVGAIVRLGESLSLPVTAEGIEDAETGERLRAMGCERGQGYHYGRPQSIAETRRLLAERRLLRAPPSVPVAAPDRRHDAA